MRQVKVLGGEPFYSKNIDWFIEKLYNEVEDKEALDLNIFTNASVWPKDETLKRLLKFPRVSITLSLDAINDLANVIRWGVSWDQIYSIVLKWKQTPIHLHINNTVSIQNVNHAKDFLQFANNNNIEVSFNFLDHPNYLSVYQFPLKEREKWILQGDSKTEKLFNSSLLADIKTENELNSFLKSLDILDAYQKCSFKNVNNEMYELARKYS
jgi:molybdenum cofactor biosynthesis enzyme MoaA